MGCDIHLFCERWDTEKKQWLSVYPPKGDGTWSDWGKYTDYPTEMEQLAWTHTAVEDTPEPGTAPFWYFGRDYASFGYLAGVRGDGPAFEEPRDFPEDASNGVRRQYWLKIVDGNGDTKESGTVTRERAACWINRENGERYCSLDGQDYVSHPDWHTTSHYTLLELISYIRERESETGEQVSHRVNELVVAMKSVAKEYGLHKEYVRAVFWFDN